MDDEFWARVAAVRWTPIEHPRIWRAVPPTRFRRALRRVAEVRNEAMSKQAYDYALDAIAHNHSGTLYPVVVPALPFLLELSTEGPPWPRRTALEVLIDAVGWLRHCDREDRYPVDVAAAITEVGRFRERLERTAARNPWLKGLVVELLEVLDETPA